MLIRASASNATGLKSRAMISAPTTANPRASAQRVFVAENATLIGDVDARRRLLDLVSAP